MVFTTVLGGSRIVINDILLWSSQLRWWRNDAVTQQKAEKIMTKLFDLFQPANLPLAS
jgi:hypothetical protein